MKHLKLSALFLIILLILSMAGCSKSAPGAPDSTSSATNNPSTSTTSAAEDPSTAPESTAAPEKVVITVDYATDTHLNSYQSFHEYADAELEYADHAEKIIFMTSAPAKNFKFIEIGFEADDTEIRFFEESVLYSLPELLPEKPLVVTWLSQGTIPNRGITFTDETGTARYFCVTQSGKDGSVLLVEFD